MGTILLAFESGALSETQLDQVRAIMPDMPLAVTLDRNKITELLEEIEIVAGNFPKDLLVTAPQLRWFQQWSAGSDWLLHHPEVAGLDLTLTRVAAVQPVPVSEHVLAFLFTFARAFHRAIPAQRRGEWFHLADQTKEVFELAGKTMLLVGLGAIGERTAQMATALGMRVLGVRRNPESSAPGVTAMHGPDRLLEVLPEADFVVLIVPLTRETQGLVGEPELRAMKPTAYLINVGRGAVIREPALIRALREGWIAGAGLDVFEEEPLPPDSPLWEMENVVITGHYAGSTPMYDQRGMAIFIENLRRYRAGQPLRYVVDKQRLY